MKKKNILTIALSLCLAAVIAVGATLAYFTDDTDKMSNVVTTGNVKIKLNDESKEIEGQVQGTVTKDDDGKQTGIAYDDIMPGNTISKQVSVEKLDDTQDCYVAIRVDVTDPALTEGVVTIDENHKKDIMDDIKATAAQNGWQCHEITNTSAIFYYDTLLTGTDKKDLFDSVEIPGETWKNEVVNATFVIDVKAAAVQAANLDAPAMVEFPEASGTYVPNTALEQLIGLLNPTTAGDGE